MFDLVHTPSLDAPKTHSIPMEGNTIYLERRDPMGFIYLRLETGEVSAKYQGAYTDMRVAEIDAKRYIEERKLALKDIKKNDKTARNHSRE